MKDIYTGICPLIVGEVRPWPWWGQRRRQDHASAHPDRIVKIGTLQISVANSGGKSKLKRENGVTLNLKMYLSPYCPGEYIFCFWPESLSISSSNHADSLSRAALKSVRFMGETVYELVYMEHLMEVMKSDPHARFSIGQDGFLVLQKDGLQL
jgi:hypothetical protein